MLNHISGNPLIYNTASPQGYGPGETWDRGLLRDIGEAMTIDAQYASALSGFNRLILWAPNADLARDPRRGRTEECFGEDPLLAGELVAAEVRGIQGDDPNHWRGAALMKHFLANSNEDGRDHTDSRFDEALFRDYYSYAFWKGVKDGGARSLMCAYNKYNGVPCSANDFIQDILIDEWGMDGPIINDGSALSLLVNSHHYAEDMKHGVAIHEALEEGLITEELSTAMSVSTSALCSDSVCSTRPKHSNSPTQRPGRPKNIWHWHSKQPRSPWCC